MGLNWSLKEIYSSFQGEDFLNDLKRADELSGLYEKLAGSICESHDDEKNKLEEFINKASEVESLFSRLFSFVNLTLSVDTKNKAALKYSDILQEKNSGFAEPNAKIEKWIGEVKDIDKLINSSSLLKEHEFFLREIVAGSKYLLSDKEESLIAKLRNTGSNSWSKLRDLLTSTVLVDIEVDGEVKALPLTVVRNMAYDKDAKVRKNAYEAELKSYKKVDDGIAAALNGIKGEVITLAKLRGYKSPLEETLLKSRMDEESLEAMLTAMKESLPAFRKYLRRKAELLGYKNGLPFYELFAPMGDVDMEFPYEKGQKFVEDNFRTFSDNLADFARKAFDSDWIDVMPKEGKVGGAFCSNLHFIKQSRFLLNYGNNFGDVVTLAHELGHGYHDECVKDKSVLNSDYPMPIAETASTFCETIVKKAAVKTATKEEAFSILESEIGDCTQVIVDIYSRFLFESELFNRREESALSAEDLNEIMLQAQKDSYGDGLDPEYLHPYMWACKPHYYDAEYNFYNFPYAFGLLFAKGLYAEYLKRGEEFVKVYDDLLASTGDRKIADVTKIIGVDIHSVDFWRSSLKIVEEDIERFIELSNEK
ncbi:M3 family oligoendopeptidase [Clostridium folliculivorans]|uniref:Oligoendopeptidase F n=1 Tax=Clostridium folliculivorans TaxID=2886038 RepID=A0A9W6DBS8_9CLOT|nr:M3 family oligoendopeptidase [Clostridium folliculivorans]GKU26760.1 oligoendopeptidase F [Clostridium folliculivorans]GKU31354.1 oligoendopeptidase F [Clostridium folliculivorans]